MRRCNQARVRINVWRLCARDCVKRKSLNVFMCVSSALWLAETFVNQDRVRLCGQRTARVWRLCWFSVLAIWQSALNYTKQMWYITHDQENNSIQPLCAKMCMIKCVIKSSQSTEPIFSILIHLRNSDLLSAASRENNMRIILGEIITAQSNSKWGWINKAG